MATETFTVAKYNASANVYLRLFDDTGQVFDFSDTTFKALAGATTPYVAATERADMDGTGFSGYTATIDLGTVNNTGALKYYTLKAYDNASPADTDLSLQNQSTGIAVRFGELINGTDTVICQCEMSVKSTAGSTAQLSVWLEHNGTKIDIDTVDASCTATLDVREHAAGADLFNATFVAGDLTLDKFQKEQASPNFTDDRQYTLIASVTENGNTHVTTHNRVVIG